MAILSKACKQDNFESHKSLELSITNIWDLCSNFIDCESLFESNSCDILALCETNLDGSTDSSNFPVRGCLPLIWKDSSTHMHSYSCFRLALLHPVPHFFSSINHLFHLCAQMKFSWSNHLLFLSLETLVSIIS